MSKPKCSFAKENSVRKLCVDLCSGLGGFSEAFVQDGWEVIRIDIERKFKPTVLADVRFLPLKEGLEPDVLLASPPCQRFSIACPQWPKKGIQKAMEIVGACFEAVVSLKPKRWLIENPRGRLRWFVGKPKMMVRYSDYDMKYPINKFTDFWGNIPLPMVKFERPIRVGHFDEGWMRKHACSWILPRDNARRSLIPLGVSEAVLEGVNQP